MRKSNKSFSINALILVLAGFMMASTSVVYSDEKKSEDVAETAKANDAKDAGKKKKKDAEEPECE